MLMKAISSDRIGVQIRSGDAGYIRRINTTRATPTTMTLKVNATLMTALPIKITINS
jgi:hypothetical protein